MKDESLENSTCPNQRIALVSTPWPLFNRPSIQLGTLKAHLKSEFPDLEIDAHHFYLKTAAGIGYKIYQAISERTWLAETVYAALLFPDRMEQAEKLFKREASGNPVLCGIKFETVVDQIREVSENFIQNINWNNYMLAGFSVCLCQLTSFLFFIRQIKKKFPKLTIAAGGSMFAGTHVRNLFQFFPETDIVVVGEGEYPLSRIIRHLKEPEAHDDISSIPGVVTIKTPADKSVCFWQMEDLNSLMPPDFDDYFDLLKKMGPQKTFFPTLPVEISRGCWWRRTHKKSKVTNQESPKGCAFCNLNLQWEGYRSKKSNKAVSEIDSLTSKHKTLSIAVMDNVLPVKDSTDIFSELSRLNKDFKLFCEIRASVTLDELETMKSAGLHEVQIGIEALSTSLLRKMNKGTTAIKNLEIMKNCEALGIANMSNLMLQFPGSSSQDVDETLRALEFAMPFYPLRRVHFWLGLESPVWKNPGKFGIKSVFNHPNYSALFPQDMFRSMFFMIQAYRGDILYQKKLWIPVRKKIKEWKKAYRQLHSKSSSPILSFRDGREFLIIQQKRLEHEPLTHRLEGTSRAVYLFCQTHRSVKEIVDNFSQTGQEKIVPFLKMMTDKKLMFEESGKYLSLAVPVKYF